MKKWLSLLFVVASMLLLSAGMVHAAKTEPLIPKLILDGKALQPPVPPIVVDKTVMIPVRIATSSLGYKVDYSNKKRQVTVSNGSKQLVMTLDQKTAYLDNKPMEMVTAPLLLSKNILIPLRFLGDSLGVQVFWDNQIKSAFLFSSNLADNTEAPPSQPSDGGLIGIVDETDSAANGSGSSGGTAPDPVTPETPVTPVTPPIAPPVSGNLYEVRYETDAVFVKYDGFIAPTVFKLTNPNRIVIDIPNTQYVSNFLPTVDFTTTNEGKMFVTEHQALQSVRYSMFGELTKFPRFVLDLNQNWDYEVKNDPLLGELRILLKEPAEDKSIYTVVLDAGHGGKDPGAKGISGKWEKTFNLSVILKVRDLLAGDERLNLVLTRADDSFPSLADRYNLANSVNADLFVSVHANSSERSDINGTETYYTREDSKAFASLMHSYFAPATGLKDNGYKRHSVNLAVTTKTTMPAILLEVGYLSSKIDEPQLWSEQLQNRVAQAIATGIKQQLNLT